MRETQWIEWTRTKLQARECEDLVTALTPEQKALLLEHDYVWVAGMGVLWRPPDGHLLRRARFTHGTHFQTQHGEFYIDSEGSVRELSNHRIAQATPTARPPSLLGGTNEDGSAAKGSTTQPPSRRVALGEGVDHGTQSLLETAPSRGGL